MSTSTTDMPSVEQIMLKTDEFPVIHEHTIFKEALEKMSNAGLGIACVINDDGILNGILTDGDIRRKLITIQKPFSAMFVDDVIVHAIKSPTTIFIDSNLKSSITLMGQKKIWDLPVVDQENRLKGLLHLHPLVEILMKDY